MLLEYSSINNNIMNHILFLQAILPEEQPSFAFGVKHSPYLYTGKQVTGDRWVSTKTEMGQKTEEEFRPRSGTFTRDKPTMLRSTAAIRQSQAVA